MINFIKPDPKMQPCIDMFNKVFNTLSTIIHEIQSISFFESKSLLKEEAELLVFLEFSRQLLLRTKAANEAAPAIEVQNEFDEVEAPKAHFEYWLHDQEADGTAYILRQREADIPIKEHPDYSLKDWQSAVKNRKTFLGYKEWAQHCEERDKPKSF